MPVTLTDPEATGGFVDPSPFVDEQGRLVLFYLLGIIGQNPASCAPEETTCVKHFHSAVEVEGSDGTAFVAEPGDRVQVTIHMPGSASDPDIFYDGSRYVLYISRGANVQVYTSPYAFLVSYRSAGGSRSPMVTQRHQTRESYRPLAPGESFQYSRTLDTVFPEGSVRFTLYYRNEDNWYAGGADGKQHVRDERVVIINSTRQFTVEITEPEQETIDQALCRKRSISCTDGGGWVLACNLCRKVCPFHVGRAGKSRAAGGEPDC